MGSRKSYSNKIKIIKYKILGREDHNIEVKILFLERNIVGRLS